MKKKNCFFFSQCFFDRKRDICQCHIDGVFIVFPRFQPVYALYIMRSPVFYSIKASFRFFIPLCRYNLFLSLSLSFDIALSHPGTRRFYCLSHSLLSPLLFLFLYSLVLFFFLLSFVIKRIILIN